LALIVTPFRLAELSLQISPLTIQEQFKPGLLAQRNNGAAAKPLPPRSAKELAAPEAEDVEEPLEADEIIEPKGEEDDAAPSRPARARSQYKPKLPNYMAELYLVGTDISFKDFAESKKTKKHTVRYLIAAFWLKQYGNSPTVNIDKIYTCYSTVGWPMKISDWDVNLRQQVKSNRFRRMQTGEYAITPIGENDVRALNGTE